MVHIIIKPHLVGFTRFNLVREAVIARPRALISRVKPTNASSFHWAIFLKSLLSQSCFCGDGFALQCFLSRATLDLQGYRWSQQGGGSQARSFKDQITGLFRPGPTSENQQPSSDSLKPQSNFFLELPVKDHRSVMIAWWQCQ